MNDLRELYQEVILDHNRNPRNLGKPEVYTGEADGENAVCGDKVKIYVQSTDGVVVNITFEGAGCAICIASASLMTDFLKGKTESEIETFFNLFHGSLTEFDTPPDFKRLGKLKVFSGVREYPARVKCATLPWHTMMAALKQAEVVVSTE